MGSARVVGTIEVNFITGDPEITWEVVIDNKPVCATPCTRFIRPSTPVPLREKDPEFLHTGRRAAAITFISISGAATAAGIAMTAAGCALDSRGLCTAGLLTTPIGLAALGGSLWLLITTPQNYDVHPAQGGLTPPLFGLSFTPDRF
jgi:hypothetical protein